MAQPAEGARIYNLFPRLAGRMDHWLSHFDRIKSLGFNWIFINPFHYPGFSGSLYAPKDYYDFNPLFIDSSSAIPPMKQLENMIEEAHKRGLKVMMDLVINHSAKDHPFTKKHKEWYKKDDKGDIVSPGAWDNSQWIEWGDLAEIDNEHSPDKKRLWEYWKELVLFYTDKGFDGFRADAAYKVPNDLWSFLIHEIKNKNSESTLFAETLGCSVEQTVGIANAGFDYIFNSSKWWNYSDSWLIDQYSQTRTAAKSISFPESHDTTRLSVDYHNNLNAVKQKTIFTALFSSGWMMPIGYEFGFKKKLDVVKTSPDDWEKPNYDLSELLKSLNELRQTHQIFNEESPISILESGSPSVLLMLKESVKSKVLFLLNKDITSSSKMTVANLSGLTDSGKETVFLDISIEKRLPVVSGKSFDYTLEPGELKLIEMINKTTR